MESEENPKASTSHFTISRHASPAWRLFVLLRAIWLLEIARVLVCFDHVTCCIVNANNSAM